MDQPFQKKIILSDDVHRALERVDCFLHRSGYQVRVGRSGEEILDLVRREPPDAVLMNYYLAGLKGDDVCRALRSAPGGGRPMPLLVVGPGAPRDVAERCREAGCDEYIASPAAPNLLLQRLAASLGLQFRLHARIPAVISLSFGRIVSEFLGYSKDISEGGILVETTLPLDRGRRLYLRLFLDEQDQPIVARATVLRVDKTSEEDQYLLGMQFGSMDSTSSSRLKDYIRSRSEH
jgi:CheY-like chemotaxis protein